MENEILKSLTKFRLLLVAGGTAAVITATTAGAAPLVGVSGPSTLIGFDSAAPSMVTSTLAVTGLSNEQIGGIDFRPSTGQLYALGSAGGLYTINTATGAATAVGSGVPVSQRDRDFGIAFNPVPDAIRIVTATDLNLRVNPTAGTTTTDTPLAYAAGDVNAGTNPTVAGVAYTNQLPGPQTTTILYGIDVSTGSLVLQSPPNSGTLSTIGSLGSAFARLGQGTTVGFDIEGGTNLAFASFFNAGSANGLYSINLTTGAATLLGGLVPGGVSDIAVGSLVAVPEPGTLGLLAVGLFGLAAARRRHAG